MDNVKQLSCVFKGLQNKWEALLLLFEYLRGHDLDPLEDCHLEFLAQHLARLDTL
jgi:hypothetical protein